MRAIPAAALLLAALAPLALTPPAAAAADPGPLSWSPDPVPPDTVVSIRFAPDDGARNATLKVCLAEGGNATLCFLPTPMRASGNGTHVAETNPRWGLPAEQQVGLNVTWVDDEGVTHYWPMGVADPGRAYVFLETTSRPRETPAPAAALALAAALAIPTLARGRR